MADSDLRSSIFNIPGYLAGFESIRSPTSPLDFGVFSSFRKPRFARSSSERGREKNKDPNGSGVVGLGIIPGPARPNKNIIFGPQVRPNGPAFLGSFRRHGGSIDSSLRSKSLPTNYVESRLSGTEKEIPSSEEEIVCFSDSNGPSSSLEKSPLGVGSVPIPIVGSLSAREIELSEDYTCIISHGPNPKTIHIFGDCVLECHETDSNCFRSGAIENPELISDTVQASTFCLGCDKKIEESEEIYIGEKAFCGFDCCSGNISEEDATEEDLFLL